jgi:hypothetical protein
MKGSSKPRSAAAKVAPRDKPGSRFRDWLVDKVSKGRFAVFKDDTDEALAGRIGVTLDVLHEARAMFKARVERERLPDGQKLGYRAITERRTWYEIFMEPPEVIYREWVARRDLQQTNNGALLRSIIHLVLQSPTQPEWLTRRQTRAWPFKGDWHQQDRIREHRFRVACTINDASHEALHARARNTKVAPSAIVRWGICLLVANQLPKLPIVSVPSAMYKKAEDYCLEPRITT